MQKLVIMDDPVLRQTARPVSDFTSPALRVLSETMLAVMRHEHGVGLAAPQIGVSLRMIVYELSEEIERDGQTISMIPTTILVNPSFTPLSDDKAVGWEGCLSIPGYRGRVERWLHIRYSAQDLNGNVITGDAHGFHSRIIQHETDHLNGILYIDKSIEIEEIIQKRSE